MWRSCVIPRRHLRYRIVAIALVTLIAGACGSRIAYDYEAGVDAVGNAAPRAAHSAPETGRPPEPGSQWEAPNPDGRSEDDADQKPTTAPETVTEATPGHAAPPATTLPPPSETGECDWHANLERATFGRPADWIIRDTGAWGRAEVPGDRIWIAPRTPCDKVYSVAVHEWTHHMQGVVYGDWGVVVRELAPYGGPEVVADCGALLLGATWIKYGCEAPTSIDAAAAILRGERP